MLRRIVVCAAALVLGVAPFAARAEGSPGHTFVVTSAADRPDANPGDGACRAAGGGCTLRAALQQANASSDPDLVAFRIGDGGLAVITPASELPAITSPVTVDGSTQPGFSGAPLVRLRGTSLSDWAVGLRVIPDQRGTVVIRSLEIVRFPGPGISLEGAGGSRVVGSWIGTDGSAALGSCPGINVTSDVNLVGGARPADRNVISGNRCEGVMITGGAAGNRVQGNRVGTDPHGARAVPNLLGGVVLMHAHDNLVGGTAPGAGNLISGNGVEAGRAGVAMYFADTFRNAVRGNLVGTNAAGTRALPNFSGFGITAGAHDNVVGGASAAARNVVSGNRTDGVELRDAGTIRNRLVGNFIGVDASGDRPLGNGATGVVIEYGASRTAVGGTQDGARNVISANGEKGVSMYQEESGRNVVQGNVIGAGADRRTHLGNVLGGILVQSSGNRIGGTEPGAANLIAFNAPGRTDGGGVTISSGAHTLVRANRIHDNGGPGIDLGNNGMTPNDPGDADGGADGLQNFPLVTSAGASRASGSLFSAPSTAFVIEVFASRTCDVLGNGEGGLPVGRTRVSTDGSGHADYSVRLSRDVPAGWYVTATATDPSADTSEFSPCLALPA
jgi:trimeric autotransporter adhesin